jgi:hypothetical protein
MVCGARDGFGEEVRAVEVAIPGCADPTPAATTASALRVRSFMVVIDTNTSHFFVSGKVSTTDTVETIPYCEGRQSTSRAFPVNLRRRAQSILGLEHIAYIVRKIGIKAKAKPQAEI